MIISLIYIVMIILVLFRNNLSHHAYILINYVLLYSYSYNYYIILVILVFLDKFNVHGYPEKQLR